MEAIHRHRPPRRASSIAPARGQLEHVLGSLGDAVVLTDRDDCVTFLNHAAEQLARVSDAAALRRPCREVFPNAAPIADMVRRTRLLGQSESCGEELVRVGDRQLPLRISCSPVWGPSNEIEGVVSIIHDLSHQKTLEDQVRRNDALARLGGLVAGMAHEVRNPLGGIRGAAQLLAKRYSTQPDVAEYTGVMIREIDRLSRLVEQLLILGDSAPREMSALNIHKLLDEALALLATELSTHNVAVVRQYDPSLPEILGEEDQLTHVFLNLIKNAYEVMPSGGTLVVRTRMETDYHILRSAHGAAQFLRVEVMDSGPGFAADAVERAFEPFYTTKSKGSGLGLALCERVIHAHGGTIRARNRSEGGAVVSVNLPLVKA